MKGQEEKRLGLQIAVTALALPAGLLVAACVAIPVLAVRSWAFSLLWQWFCVPLGLPTLNVKLVAGLFLTYGVAHYEREYKDRKTDFKTVKTAFLQQTIGPLFTVGLAWLIRRWM